MAASVLSSLLAAVPASADEIAKGYRGTYRDAGNTVRLELRKDKATLTAAGATRTAEFKRTDYTDAYEHLLKGKTFVYLVRAKSGANTFDVYWITPQASTRKEEGGLVAYRAQILYARINRDQPANVASLKVVHSTDGMVTLDTTTRRWQAGWGREAAEYEMLREATAANS